jgi:hypothetical protein
LRQTAPVRGTRLGRPSAITRVAMSENPIDFVIVIDGAPSLAFP